MATTKVSTKLLETVGVAEGGTGAVSASAARTALGLVIGTNVLAPNGSAASLTNLPAGGASATEAANIMINSFNIAAAGGFAFQNMVDGVVDEFEDETGVDTSTSTNETYAAGGNSYSNAGATSTTDSIPDMTGNTAPSGVASSGGVTGSNANAWKAFNRSGSYSADNFIGTNSPGSTHPVGWVKYDFGSGNEKVIAGYDVNSQTSEASSYDITVWKLEGSNNDSDWTELHDQTGVTWSNGEEKNFTVTSPGSYRYYRLHWTQADGLPDGGGKQCRTGYIQMYASSYDVNMTLFSNATTALAAPDDANIVIWQEDIAAITLNTDLKAYASRNGGTTYTQITLAEVASLTTGRILTGTVDISGQSSATAMKYKIETLNAKGQKIHAVALQWS